MNILGWQIGRKAADTITLDQLIQRLEAVHETVSGIDVTPENCMQSPTVHAIVTAISRRLATLPVHVIEKTTSAGRTSAEQLPNHPVARLLRAPNDWQTNVSYWLDAVSWLARYGNFYAFKARGVTGPIRRLEPLPSSTVDIEQREDMSLVYKITMAHGRQIERGPDEIHHVRGPARNGYKGDSPIWDAREAIALEIAAERFGSTFFGNGAMPWVVFKYMQGVTGHKNVEERRQFIEDFHNLYGQKKRFRALLLPQGIDIGTPISVDNDKHQFLETRKLQRTIIAGAFGVPARFVGDLENAHFNNVEQQSLDFVQTVVLPYARIFEAAMERDLLTAEDRSRGVCIRFNLDGALRGDFKTRQEGMKIMREAGALTPNEWREREGLNPLREGQGGDDVWQQGPSGQQPTTGNPPGDDDDGD